MLIVYLDKIDVQYHYQYMNLFTNYILKEGEILYLGVGRGLVLEIKKGRLREKKTRKEKKEMYMVVESCFKIRT